MDVHPLSRLLSYTRADIGFPFDSRSGSLPPSILGIARLPHGTHLKIFRMVHAAVDSVWSGPTGAKSVTALACACCMHMHSMRMQLHAHCHPHRRDQHRGWAIRPASCPSSPVHRRVPSDRQTPRTGVPATHSRHIRGANAAGSQRNRSATDQRSRPSCCKTDIPRGNTARH